MTAAAQHPSGAHAKRIHLSAQLSTPRLQPFLHAAGGNYKAALKLYGWNIDVSGASYEALHLFEVVLRNAMDRELCVWNGQQVDRTTSRSHQNDWLVDPSRLLGRLLRNDLAKATQRAQQAVRGSGRRPGHPDILAQLSLGTWRFLLPDRDQGRQLLWRQALVHAFPHLTDPPHVLVDNVRIVHQFRNRVAHLEPLLAQGAVRTEFLAMRYVLRAIDPPTEQWFTSRQRITRVLRERPT